MNQDREDCRSGSMEARVELRLPFETWEITEAD